MRRQRNRSQMKELVNSPVEELGEMEASNLSDREFIRILSSMKKDIETKKKKKKDKSEIKNAIFEINTTLEGRNSKLDEAEDQISDFEQGRKKTSKQIRKKKKEFLKNEESLRNILDNMKCNNIHIMRISEGEENEQGIENLFEEMTKNFPNLVKEKDTQIQEGQTVPNRLHQNGPTPRYIIMKMESLKNKERILKAAREKQVLT